MPIDLTGLLPEDDTQQTPADTSLGSGIDLSGLLPGEPSPSPGTLQPTAAPKRDKDALEKAADGLRKVGAVGQSLAEGLGHVAKEFLDETVQVFPTTFAVLKNAPENLGRELEFFNNVRKSDGLGTAVRAWGYATRESMGLPMTPEEEQSLAADMSTYIENFKDDPLKLGDHMKGLFSAGISESEWQKASLGAVNIAALFVGGPAGKGATSLLKAGSLKLLRRPPNVITKSIINAEAHSIASFVAWETGRAAVEGEDIGAAAQRGAVLGALTPPALKVAGAIVKPVAKGAVKGAVKTVTVPAKAADRAFSKIEAYVGAKNIIGELWDRGYLMVGGTSGESVVRKMGLDATADSFVQARVQYSLQAGLWEERFSSALRGLNKNKRQLIGRYLAAGPEGEGAILLEGQAQGFNTTLMLQRAGQIFELLGEIGTKAEQAQVMQKDAVTKQFRTFFKRNDFGMPHIYVDTNRFIKPGALREEALEVLKTQHKKTQAEAEKILEEIHNKSKGELSAREYQGFSNLMGRRWNLPGYEMDPGSVIPEYIGRMAREIEYASRFGAEAATPVRGGLSAELLEEGIASGVQFNKGKVRDQFPLAFQELAQITEPRKLALAEEILIDQLGGFRSGEWAVQKLEKVLQHQAIAKLGTAQLSQFTQFMAPFGPSGFRDAMGDFLNLWSKDPAIHTRVTQSGAFLQTIIRASREAIAGSGAERVSRTLRQIGFTGLDTQARRFGVLRGFSMASHASEELVEMVARRPFAGSFERKVIDRRIAKINRRFRKLGLDGDEIADRGGVLLEEEYLQAGQKLSTDINFWSDAFSLPTFWRSPWGRVLTQFRSFIFQQTKYVKNQLVKPALEDGDYAPLLRHVAGSALVGEAVADAKSLVRLRARDKEGFPRLIENMAYGATTGMFLDVINATNYSDGIYSMAFGPTVGDVVDIGNGIFDIGKSKGPRTLLKKGVQISVPYVPIIGPIITPGVTNILFPPKQKKK